MAEQKHHIMQGTEADFAELKRRNEERGGEAQYYVVKQGAKHIVVAEAQFDAVTGYRGPSHGPYNQSKAQAVAEARNGAPPQNEALARQYTEAGGL